MAATLKQPGSRRDRGARDAPAGEPDPRWEAFAKRDKAADGQFVAAVITTGIYCRPGCPARLPRRENVRFFASGAEAERAGFRPCKRCRPDAASIEERLTGAVRASLRADRGGGGRARFRCYRRRGGAQPASSSPRFQADRGGNARRLFQILAGGQGGRRA